MLSKSRAVQKFFKPLILSNLLLIDFCVSLPADPGDKGFVEKFPQIENI